MIVDCFPFFNEVELVELRFELLTHAVDYFVVVESNFTHSGVRKPLHFLMNEEKWEPYRDQIVYVDMDLSAYSGDWEREGAQRDAIRNGLRELDTRPEDHVLISDADEIPHPAFVSKRTEGWAQMDMYTYYVNLKASYPWVGTLGISYEQLGELKPSQWRSDMHRGWYGPFEVHRGGGWHFSSLGGVERVRDKLRAYAHQEYNTPENLELVEYRLKHGEDLFGRGETYERVDAPWVCQEMIQRYPHLYL